MKNNELVVTTQINNNLENVNIFDVNIINRWFAFADVTQKSQSTYMAALKQMFKYFATNNIVKPARVDIENWRDELKQTRKPATVALYMTTAKIFFKWLAQEKIYDNIADNVKCRIKTAKTHKKDALSVQQSKDLLAVTNGNSLKAKRDKAIIALMLTCALRTVEVVRSNVEDLRTVNGVLMLFVQGKGRDSKNECVAIPSQVEVLIREYLSARGDYKVDSPLFVATSNRNKGARLQTQTISRLVKSKLRAAGMDSPKLTAHSLRHYAGTQMVLNGSSLQQVQQVLRHVNVSTTMIYLHDVERIKNRAEQSVADVLFSA